ncbi:hypothetical protein QBC41DRAFT_381780 [Cercophora samala]|uniref:Uncharacterized protein n=1 Tax=Cercophora samala TaxID=330535 RepID=A0AA40D5M1_9PEZI|nr:hypothetical protein QBC41DRAFT_381780 [Cercophora samala]
MSRSRVAYFQQQKALINFRENCLVCQALDNQPPNNTQNPSQIPPPDTQQQQPGSQSQPPSPSQYQQQHPIQPIPPCSRCTLITKWIKKDYHTPSMMTKILEISEVFHFEEMLALLNDAVIERVAKKTGIQEDRDAEWVVTPYRRSWKGERSVEQKDLARKGVPYPLAEDFRVVHEKAMRRKVVFTEVGCHIGAYDMVRCGTSERI